jgi:hypothetical protein
LKIFCGLKFGPQITNCSGMPFPLSRIVIWGKPQTPRPWVEYNTVAFYEADQTFCLVFGNEERILFNVLFIGDACSAGTLHKLDRSFHHPITPCNGEFGSDLIILWMMFSFLLVAMQNI